MSLAAYQNSQDLDVLSATPMQLVRMLYVGAIGSIQSACDHLRDGNIRERSRQITKACSIIEELTLSLDKERGGQVAKDLTELYVYLHKRLIAANIEQQVEPMIEVKRLLETLLEAWQAVPDSVPPSESPRANYGAARDFGGGDSEFPAERIPLQLSA